MKEIQIQVTIRAQAKADDPDMKEMLDEIPTMAQELLDEENDVQEVTVTTKTRDVGSSLWNAGPSSHATRA